MKKGTTIIYIFIGIALAVSLILHLATEGLHHAGLYTIVGFAGAWILILLGKVLLPAMLARKEDYYGGNDE